MSSRSTGCHVLLQGLIAGVLLGLNTTVFAYGATGSGKTYTMVGSPTDPGIMVLSMSDIFAFMVRSGPCTLCGVRRGGLGGGVQGGSRSFLVELMLGVKPVTWGRSLHREWGPEFLRGQAPDLSAPCVGCGVCQTLVRFQG